MLIVTERIDTLRRVLARIRADGAPARVRVDVAPTRGFPWVAWSGQRGPTGVIRRHSVQIGRSHSVHERPVSRSGWR